MELLIVGLFGAILYLGPEDVDKLFQNNEPQKQEQQLAETQTSPEQLGSLSRQYDPLNPDAIYVSPEVETLMVEESSSEESNTGKVSAKIDQLSKPFNVWLSKIKQENQARADRHSFMRSRKVGE